MEDRDRIRAAIDRIDRRLSDLLEERLLLAGVLVEAKRAAGATVLDPDREELVLNNYEKGGPRQIALAILRVSKGADRE